MAIEDFKRWHWIVISLVIGAALSYLWITVPPGELSASRHELSEAEMFRDLQLGKTDKGFPLVRNLVVYPAETTIDQTGKTVRTMYVAGEYLEPRGPGKGLYKRFQKTTEVPFRPPGARTPPSDSYTVRDHINQLAKNHPEIHYRYAWWSLPAAVVAIWGGGAVLLIGGVWPTLLGLMIGAGLGRPKTQKSDEYDLERFSHSAPEPQSKPSAPAVSPDDHEKLRKLAETLERNLAAAGVTETPPAEVPAAEAASAVKQLSGGPMDSPVPTAAQDQEPREYTGEFYPVVRSGAHKHEPNAAEPKH